jgi:hypothetical protein
MTCRLVFWARLCTRQCLRHGSYRIFFAVRAVADCTPLWCASPVVFLSLERKMDPKITGLSVYFCTLVSWSAFTLPVA